MHSFFSYCISNAVDFCFCLHAQHGNWVSCRVGFLAGIFIMLVSVATVAGRWFAGKWIIYQHVVFLINKFVKLHFPIVTLTLRRPN